MKRVGFGVACVSFPSGRGGTVTLSGRYEVMQLIDPADAAAAIGGAICIAHEFGNDGISFGPSEARSLGETLIKAAGDCEAQIEQRKKGAS